MAEPLNTADLRGWADDDLVPRDAAELMVRAADELDRLRAALGRIANYESATDAELDAVMWHIADRGFLTHAGAIATAALTHTGEASGG